ncbi:MAG: O-antigen ligase family protein [Novosphingobium sp.]
MAQHLRPEHGCTTSHWIAWRRTVPNTFAYTVLYLWPVLTAFGLRSLPLNRAIVCSGLAGFLLLPTAVIDLIGLPDLNKNSVVLIGIITTYMFHRRPREFNAITRESVWLMAGLLASALATTLNNADPLLKPHLPVPGLTMYDALGMTFHNVLIVSVVMIGARTLYRWEDHRELLILLGAAMVLYSPLVLLELRLSPQLHAWIYGFAPFSFDQQMRSGGFRASVFLSHGLVLAWFLVIGTTALMALRRSRERVFGLRPQFLSAYLGVILLLQKSLGALVIGGAFSLALLMRPRKQVALAAVIAAMFLAYPAVRGAGVVPVEWINSKVAEHSSERSGSFGTRLTNEDQLLAKANQRPWFGWGGWGRARIFDPETGRDISITDGYWIIVLGFSGWVGYLCQFGLICLPLLALYRYRRQVTRETAGVALILAANLIDMIPNSSITPITWLMAGALAGTVAAARRSRTATRPAALPGSSDGSWAAGAPALR